MLNRDDFKYCSSFESNGLGAQNPLYREEQDFKMVLSSEKWCKYIEWGVPI